ncbi:threonine synthase [Tuwongella immobilis]|uniref:Threonine synthase n=1 Tax=Tuwongella immobilis TaxID=692036 RepID=A0A6C2YW78_9BACT|nr:threonine synthase [Tuwongella immobilis]VIP05766.1 threonine synthase : Threonine synthase OS=Singulisphaera acidiphila (strain ATCC BAA-1392 / DSM 18658 / VKM B-2454 / MOB10) GN=Sinac_6665 PE=4 SV=1: PALP [Tuwongella immobilis]VTS08888.1 threonine synthase : Threonine synthase OS=Singulisphaera acidiphila (strain ATCC BAA-1392 / DSM 18658 / VKM B-2454 / MOB10) GN=Sinac_6665 PE=4 SV=1: PALP [Tuwongella immobilis]
MSACDFVLGLKCKVCGKLYPKQPLNFCTDDFGPLEVVYDYEAIRPAISRAKIEMRPFNMWRYRELLPLDGEPTVGPQVGGTPLIKADRLAEALGVKRVWIKNDAVNFPTLSFKDRVVSVALSKAREFGFKTVGCASTGNLANSVAANAASVGLDTYIFVPADLERAKILGTSVYGAKVIGVTGTYDEVNRLCTQVAFKYGWGFVNINLRPFYAEGSKTMGYEIAEELGWRVPQHVIAPMAGGSLIGKVHKAFWELEQVGLIAEGSIGKVKMYGAQASGCNPITDAVKTSRERHRPVRKPNTICKSLSIGDPADGYFAAKLMRDTGGWGDDATDPEIVEGMLLLARTEGVFAETAGGVTVAVARKLIESGRIPRDEEIVLCITGNGLKTQDCIAEAVQETPIIRPNIDDFVPMMEGEAAAQPAMA